MEKDKIIRVADVVPLAQFVFNEQIKLVHVYVHEELRSEVSER